jgi:hypothetical protein
MQITRKKYKAYLAAFYNMSGLRALAHESRPDTFGTGWHVMRNGEKVRVDVDLTEESFRSYHDYVYPVPDFVYPLTATTSNDKCLSWTKNGFLYTLGNSEYDLMLPCTPPPPILKV